MSLSYITLARAKGALRGTYDGSDDGTLSAIIESVSAFADNYTNRSSGSFHVQNYDELLNGTGSNLIYLNNVPLVSVSRIATIPLPAMFVHNTDPDMGARATVAVTATGLTLTYVKGGVNGNLPVITTIPFASYPTVQLVSDQVNAAGNFWQAGVMGGFGNWLSSDLRSTQGAFGARVVTAYLWIHYFDLPWFRVNEQTGEVFSPMGFVRGVYNYRVSYQAGYDSVPDDLQQVLAELVAASYYSRELNANVQSESLGAFSYTQIVSDKFQGLSKVAQRTLGVYKRRPVPKFSTY